MAAGLRRELMDAEERMTRLELLVEAEPVPDHVAGTTRSLHQVCQVAARELGMSGATVSVMAGDRVSGIVAAVDQESTDVTEVQFTVGEGPGWEAFECREPVLSGDLQLDERWPGYRSAMSERGVRAAFAFPLVVGPSRLGVLDLFRDAPGRLLSVRVAQGVDLAAIASACLLDGQDHAPDGQSLPVVHEALESRFPIYQAQGMVHVQLGVGLPAALARMRAHAYAQDRTLGEVARDVVARTLTLHNDNDDRQ